MRNKFNQTGLIITGAAAFFMGFAGNIQAIPMSMHDLSVFETVQSANLSQQDQSVVTLTASELARALKEENAVAHKEAAQLAKSLKKKKVVASRGLIASHASPNNNGASVTPTLPTFQNSSPLYLPQNGTPGLAPYVFQDPAITSLGHPQSGTPAQVSSAAVGVPDGGATAIMMIGAFYGLVVLRKKLESRSVLSTSGI